MEDIKNDVESGNLEQVEEQEVKNGYNGEGPSLRKQINDAGYVLKLGVTNKMLEKFAFDVATMYNNKFVDYSAFINLLGDYIVSINYAEKLIGRVEKRPENLENISQVNEIISSQYEEIKKNRLSANNRLMDGVDFSILFLRSAQWAFILVLIGVIGQAFHVFHVVTNISDLVGWSKPVNGLLWSIFLSFGLVYFSLKLSTIDVSDYKKIRKYERTVNWFIAFDVFANLYYWGYKFVLMPAVLDKYVKDGDVDWGSVNWLTFDVTRIQWPQMMAGLVFAVSIPFILKAFAGEINLPSMLDKVFRSYKD